MIAGESSRVCSQKVLAFGLCSLLGAIWALGGVEKGDPWCARLGCDTPAGGRLHRVLKDIASPSQSLLLKMKR